MLKYLHIENIAVIESADIEPTSGFNALTGETGAGKSIIIDSINAVLGERTSKEIIRNGCDKATVSAVFGNLSAESLAVLKEQGIEPDEDGNISVHRVLSLTGNGSVRMGGRVVTTQILRDVAKHLINIHGQHDSQMLLRPENHYIYLDLVAENLAEREAYSTAFNNFTKIRRQIKELETDEDKKYDRIDLLKFQIEELQSADIKVGEIQKLRKTRELFQNSEKILKLVDECLYVLCGDADSDGANAMVRSAGLFLEKTGAEDLTEVSSQLSASCENLESVADALRKYVADFPYSKEEAEKTDERLDILHKIMLKYGGSEESALAHLENAQNELAKIELGDELLAKLEEELEVAEQTLVKAGERLSASRRRTAKFFEEQVCEALSFMDMNGVKFIVDIAESKYSKNGRDKVEFFISANAGETVKPLYKVASGGELSRIMLAIKSIIADKDDVDTLIFDEIDTGISGRAASKVAVQLQKVSKLRQVICVTHLAQIAAAAEGHFLIEKSVSGGKTYTKVELLNENERIKEIARIMTGAQLTENTISSAKELLDRSKIQ